MKIRILAASLIFAGSLCAQFSVRIGPPPPPRIIYQTPAPGPGYVWVDGYWYPQGNQYRWHQGYWTRPPYQGSRWVGPRHDGDQYYNGYWDGDRGRFEHDHQWDRDHNHDYRGEFHGNHEDRH